VFVEVGANQPTEFHRRLRSIYEKIATIEVNNSVSSDFKSFEDLRDECADVVAHYFVLEHVPRVVEFLKNCYRILRHGGVMVCEVPDIQVYPGDPTALLLYEHTNHFSKHILCKIASQVGFAQLKIDASLCSRPFGFAVAFHKSDSRDKRSFPSEYRKNRQLFNEGVKQLERLQDDMEHAGGKLKTYEHHNETVIFWGANDLMARFLDQYPLFENVTIVDSNIEKIDFMPGATVFTPSAAAVKIRKADAIFIFTRLHAAEILSQIELSIGKKFKPENVHVVDPFGGVLPRCV
jgi:SAM-dependent methyltransferase